MKVRQITEQEKAAIIKEAVRIGYQGSNRAFTDCAESVFKQLKEKGFYIASPQKD